MSPLLAYLQPADSQRSHSDLLENKKQTKTSPSERRYGTNSEISPSKVSESIFSDQKYGKFRLIREERESGKIKQINDSKTISQTKIIDN